MSGPPGDLICWGSLCMPAPGTVWADAGVLIRDGRIAAAGPVGELRAQAAGAAELGGPGHAWTAGLVNAHSHGNGVDAAGRGIPDRPLESWIHALAGGPSLDPGLDALWCDVQLLEAGVTTVLHHAYETDAEALDSVCEAHRLSGIRALVALGISDQNRLVHAGEAEVLATIPEPLRPLARELAAVKLGDGDAWLDLARQAAGSAGGPRLRIGLGPSGPHWCSDALWERIAAAGRDGGLAIHTHIAESPLEAAHARRVYGRSAIAHLQQLGALTPRTSLAHAVHCEPGDADRLAECGVTVVHNPGSNLRLGNGTAPVPALLAAGVPLALGTDDTALNATHDLLGEARLAWRLHREPPAARTVWAMATSAGAQACGFGPGTLTPGAPADCVGWDLSALRGPLPGLPGGLAETLLARGGPAAVDLVCVAGRLVVRGGRHVAGERDDWAAAWTDMLRSAPRRHRLGAAAALIWPYLDAFYREWDR